MPYADVLTVTVGAVPFTGGESVLLGGYLLLLVGCVTVSAGLWLWRRVSRITGRRDY